MDGILLVDKPAGISSFGVVSRVRKQLSGEAGYRLKVGHTGTLDPFATGLLILVVGKSTKRAGEFSKLDKVYQAEIELGSISTTADPEGEITKKSAKIPTTEEINAVLNQLTGNIKQTPPVYSAIKVGGQRAYKLARAGRDVKMEPRTVTIYKITDVNYNYPTVRFKVKVSSGTYIRSLAEDIGKKLGTGAYLSSLRRTKVGDFKVENANKLVMTENHSTYLLLK